ncbi:MAG: hypothetical protein GYB67_14620 [Chloroflexi bacterium]|nr:hypothetical protein [Chloroflexota bacterium]
MNDIDDETRDTAAAPFDMGHAALRLIVGSVLEGADEFSKRLQRWEHETAATLTAAADDPPTAEHERLRHALIGLAFVAQDRLRQETARWLDFPSQSTRSLIDMAERMAGNPLLRPFAKPFKANLETMAQQVEAEVERWRQIGQQEEPRSRALSRKALEEIVDEVLEELAKNPELQSLIQQQSIGLAEEVVDNMREVTVTADSVVEGIARRLLRRQPRNQLPPADLRLQAQGEKESDDDNNG